MALSHKKLLKKKNKKQKKNKNKSNQKVSNGKGIHELQVVAAWKTESVSGMIMVCFVRRVNNAEYHILVYLLDTWALGVKDSYMQRMNAHTYEESIANSQHYQRGEPGELKGLVLDTVKFGKNNGFTPFGDYPKMLPYLANISIDNSELHGLVFGHNGRVVYMANSETETDKEITSRILMLEKKLGKGNFDIIKPDFEGGPEVPSEHMVQKNEQLVHETLYTKKNKDDFVNTLTDEPHMFARLYYRVKNKDNALKSLYKLKCIAFQDDSTFYIYYQKEAKKFGLAVPYNKIPKDLQPLILGGGSFVAPDVLKIDVRSYQRASNMVTFIDKHVPREDLFLEELAHYNEVMTESEANISFDQIFSEIENRDGKSKNNSSEEKIITDKNDSIFESAISNELVSKLPIDYYTLGIIGVEFRLKARLAVAVEHAKGNKDFTIADWIASYAMNGTTYNTID